MGEIRHLVQAATDAMEANDLPALDRSVKAIATLANGTRLTSAQRESLTRLAAQLDRAARATRDVICLLDQAAQSAIAYQTYNGQGQTIISRASIAKEKF